MGIQINLGDHQSKVKYFFPIPQRHRAAIQWARSQALIISRELTSANSYFMNLPGHRSLRALLADSRIWINYIALEYNVGGQSMSEFGYHEIGIQERMFSKGKKWVLGTLIHELAHQNGAEGSPSMDAELAVFHCGLGTVQEWMSGVDDPRTPYEPGLKG